MLSLKEGIPLLRDLLSFLEESADSYDVSSMPERNGLFCSNSAFFQQITFLEESDLKWCHT